MLSAMESGVISQYQDAVSIATRPLLSLKGQSLDELNKEILHVSDILFLASNLLPTFRSSNKSNKIENTELKCLCRTSKKAWKLWHVRQFITRLRARLECTRIQRRDQMFKNKEKVSSHLVTHPLIQTKSFLPSIAWSVAKLLAQTISDLNTSSMVATALHNGSPRSITESLRRHPPLHKRRYCYSDIQKTRPFCRFLLIIQGDRCWSSTIVL